MGRLGRVVLLVSIGASGCATEQMNYYPPGELRAERYETIPIAPGMTSTPSTIVPLPPEQFIDAKASSHAVEWPSSLGS